MLELHVVYFAHKRVLMSITIITSIGALAFVFGDGASTLPRFLCPWNPPGLSLYGTLATIRPLCLLIEVGNTNALSLRKTWDIRSSCRGSLNSRSDPGSPRLAEHFQNARFSRFTGLSLATVSSSSSWVRSIGRSRFIEPSSLGLCSGFTSGTSRARMCRTSSRASSAVRSCGSRSSSGSGDTLQGIIPSTWRSPV
jgi:hypothetical protein